MNSIELLDSINFQTRRLLAPDFAPIWFEERMNYGGCGKSLATVKWEQLRPKMSRWLRDACNTNGVYVGEWLCPNSFSAKACRASDGWLIAIPSSLMTSIYQVSRCIAEWIPLAESVPQINDDDSVRKEIRIALRWLAMTGLALPAGQELSIQRIQFAEILATYSEWFVICHELAHTLFFHSQLSPSDISDGKWLFHQLLGDLRFFRETAMNEVDTSLSHAKEFAADLRGLEFLMGANHVPCEDVLDPSIQHSLNVQHLEMSWAGAALYLLATGIISELSGDAETESHPSWWKRHQNLQTDLMAKAQERSDLWFGSLHGAIAHILQPVINWAVESRGSETAAIAVAKFSAVFENASRCETPNYSLVLLKAVEMLNSESGPEVYQFIRNEWQRVSPMFLDNADFEKLLNEDLVNGMTVPGELTRVNSSHWRIEMRKFKLLLSLGRRLPTQLTALMKMPDPW